MKQIHDKHSAGRWSPLMLLMLAGALGLFARAWTIAHTERQGYAVDDLFDALAWNLVSLGAFTRDGMTPSAHVGPLYPFVLAVFYGVAGHRPEWVPYLHAAFDAGASACIFFVGRRLFGSWIGAIAAASMFLYPTYWTYGDRQAYRSADWRSRRSSSSSRSPGSNPALGAFAVFNQIVRGDGPQRLSALRGRCDPLRRADWSNSPHYRIPLGPPSDRPCLSRLLRPRH